jgi:hypothetical protein
LFSSVIENSQLTIINGLNISVPSDLDEAIIRYIEYHEWFDSRPDKIKHVRMIEDFIENNKIPQNVFFDKIHYYLKFSTQLDSRRVSQNSLFRKFQRILRKFKSAYVYLNKNGVAKTLRYSYQKVMG